MDTIKQRFAELKEKVDEAESRGSDAKAKLALIQETQVAREAEAKSLKNRIATLQAELQKVQGKCNESLSKLDDNDMRSKQSEDSRKRLQDKEDEGFESLRELEVAVKNLAYDKEEKENLLREAELREKALVCDIKRVEGNLGKASEKTESLSKEREELSKSVKSVENTVNMRHEKEDGSKDRITALDDQLKMITATLEDVLAKEKTLQRLKERLEGDLAKESEKMSEIDRQFAEIEQGI